jgi:hypothetical protein
MPEEETVAVTITINSPFSGSVVAVGENVTIDSTATADAGIDRVELTINGQMVRRDSPPDGNPITFRVSQPWTPPAGGQATIAVIAFDANGQSSSTATISLQVAASAAAGDGAEATEAPPATEAPLAPAAPIPTEPPVTTGAGCTLDVQLASETIPDNTIMTPGDGFVKVWNVRNAGTCDWEDIELFFSEGTQMGGPGNVPLTNVPVGGETSVTMNLTAPASPGTYKGTWRIRTGEGTVFGKLWALIVVPAPVADTPSSTDAPTDAPADTPEPTIQVTIIPPVIPEGPLPYTEQVRERKSIPAGETGRATASCPDDSVLVGGGFAAPPTALAYINAPADSDSWRVDVKNAGSSSITIDAFANCLFLAGTSSSYEFQNTPVLGDSSGTVTAACPAGSVATGGGWGLHPNTSLHIFRSFKGGNGWSVFAQNEGSEGRSLTAYAVCLKGTDATTSQVHASASIASTKLGFVDAQCSGSLMTGGGFSAHPDLLVYARSPRLCQCAQSFRVGQVEHAGL